jgi:DNA polymerase-3 subunit delta
MAGARKPLKPVYLFTGTDRPRIARLWRRMLDRARQEAAGAPVTVSRLDARDAAADDAVAVLNAMSLDMAFRVVRVDGVDRWRAADGEALGPYLELPAPDAVLFLVAESVNTTMRWVKAVLAAGERVSCEAPKAWQLPDWVATAFREAGATADHAACERLVAVVGPDLDRLASEVGKLAVWAAGGPIDEAAVTEVSGGAAAPHEWALSEAVLARDPAAGARALAAFEAAGGSPGSVVWKLANPVRDLRQMAEAPDEIRPPWRRERLRRAAVRWRDGDLDDALRAIAALELDTRGRVYGEEAQAAAVARTVVRLTSARRRASAPRP